MPSHAISIGARCHAGLPGDALQRLGLVDDLGIGRTVAGAAHHAGHAHAAVAARHRRLVLMHGHALERAVAGRMAVHAARMLDDLAGLLEHGDGALVLVGDGSEGRGVAQAGAVDRFVGGNRNADSEASSSGQNGERRERNRQRRRLITIRLPARWAGAGRAGR